MKLQARDMCGHASVRFENISVLASVQIFIC